ncbi:hypothetical protein LPJ81_005254 [Coemansia sp. IMI 209127]|nr:hypothetical protein LPJ81_005254 [Coemansia sp. IMI 209127]
MLVVYVDAPLAAPDIEVTTPVQERFLGILDRILDASREHGLAKGGREKLVSGDAAVALVLSELTMLAVAPYAVQGEHIESPAALVLANHDVYRRAESAFSAYCQRVTALDSPQDSGTAASASVSGGGSKERRQKRSSAGTRTKKRVVRASFVALGEAALSRLGRILCKQNEEEGGPTIFGNVSKETSAGTKASSAMRVLLHGIWQDAVVAIGWHLVVPLASIPADRGAWDGAMTSSSVAAGYFVRVVPTGMSELGRLVASGNQELGSSAREALAAAWLSVGSVAGLALGMPTDSLAGAAIATRPSAGSLGGNDEQPQQPEETKLYWRLLVGILEWGALRVSEPVVVLGVDLAAQSFALGHEFHQNRQALTMECFRWLFLMSSAAPVPSTSLLLLPQNKAIPQWVSEAVAPTLVRRIKVVLETFVKDKALVGNSPMPLSQIELLRFILQELAQLQCQPGSLNCLLAQSRKGGADNGGAADKAGVAFREHALAGTTAHIFAMYDSLVNLLSVSDIAVLRSVQMCLRRVSAEIFK